MKFFIQGLAVEKEQTVLAPSYTFIKSIAGSLGSPEIDNWLQNIVTHVGPRRRSSKSTATKQYKCLNLKYPLYLIPTKFVIWDLNQCT